MESRLVKRNVVIMTVTWALMTPFSTALGVYNSLYIIELGGGPFEVGLVFMAGFAVLSVARLIGGYLTDALGRKKVLVPMTLIYGFASLLYAFAPNWTWILAASVISSIALLYQPAVEAIVADSLPVELRGRWMGRMSTISHALTLVGPPLATYMVTVMPLVSAMRILYLLDAGTVIISGVLRTQLIETHRAGGRPSFREFLAQYRETFSRFRGDLGMLALVISLFYGVYMMTSPYLQVYAVKGLGISESTWGVISTIATFVSVFAMLLTGHLADVLGRNMTLALSFALQSVGYGLFVVAGRGDVIAPCIGMVLLNSFHPWIPFSALTADLTTVGVRGKVSAVLGMLEGISSSISSLIGGIVYGAFASLTFGIASLLLIPLIPISLKMPRWINLEGGNERGDESGD